MQTFIRQICVMLIFIYFILFSKYINIYFTQLYLFLFLIGNYTVKVIHSCLYFYSVTNKYFSLPTMIFPNVTTISLASTHPYIWCMIHYFEPFWTSLYQANVESIITILAWILNFNLGDFGYHFFLLGSSAKYRLI